MHTVAQALLTARSGEVDPYFSSVISLQHMEGPTAFVDQIPGRTWAASGAVAITSGDKKYGTASGVNSGSSGTLTLSSPVTDFLLDGAFSIEFWFKVINTGQWGGVTLLSISDGGFGIVALSLPFGDPYVRVTRRSKSLDHGTGASIANTWTHIFAGWQANTLYLAKNGVMLSTADAVALTNPVTSVNMMANVSYGSIGAVGTYIDEMRITKGVCRYTASFTPPTNPYPDF